jgi:hypothetical protein
VLLERRQRREAPANGRGRRALDLAHEALPCNHRFSGEIGMRDQGSGDAPPATLCWREMDSNIRFPVAEIVIGGQ